MKYRVISLRVQVYPYGESLQEKLNELSDEIGEEIVSVIFLGDPDWSKAEGYRSYQVIFRVSP